jgi:hypothetical protein
MNSSIEIVEAARLAEKLIARTVEGKLSWEIVSDFPERSADIPNASPDAACFTTQLETGLKATVRQRLEEILQFSLTEVIGLHPLVPAINNANTDKVVISVSVEKDPPYGYGTPQEKFLAGRLVDLYEVARRSALKIDSSVEKALSYLDRIAG